MNKLTPKTTKEHLLDIYNKIDIIENNHLKHIEKDISRLNYILWAIGFMILTQFLAWVLRMFS
jgi:hypothetical protein